MKPVKYFIFDMPLSNSKNAINLISEFPVRKNVRDKTYKHCEIYHNINLFLYRALRTELQYFKQ